LKSKKGTKRAQDYELEDLQEAESEEVERDIKTKMSQNVTSILDRNNFSGRKSVMLMGVIARETGADLNSNIVSRSTLERHKKEK
jgi:hypothetical protein